MSKVRDAFKQLRSDYWRVCNQQPSASAIGAMHIIEEYIDKHEPKAEVVVTVTWRDRVGSYPLTSPVKLGEIGHFVEARLAEGCVDIAVSSVWEREVKS